MTFLAMCRKLTEHFALSVLTFILAVTSTVLLWPNRREDLWHRLGFVLSILLVSAVWAILFAAIARKRQWTAESCRKLPGISFFVACIFLCLLTADFSMLPFSAVSLAVGAFCRKLVYPGIPWSDMTDAQASARLTTLNI